MGRPKGSKNSYQWWEGEHPNKGKAKPTRERKCMHCGGAFLTPSTKGYCSRKCNYLANVTKPEGTDCWIWKGYKRPGGYGEAYFGTKPNRERVLAHRLAYEVMIGSPDGMAVCHRCDNPPCVNPDHLFLGTVADNTRDRDEKGRQARGEKNAPAKLTEAEVQDIRADPRGCRKLAKVYGVHMGTIMSVRRRKTWKHVK